MDYFTENGDFIERHFQKLPNPLKNWGKRNGKHYILYKIDPWKCTLIYKKISSPPEPAIAV